MRRKDSLEQLNHVHKLLLVGSKNTTQNLH
jgi:hypothetical protein